jgi:hypothetical protein
VSWVANGAAVTLPAANVAGQIIILIDATNGFSGGIQAQAGSGDHIFDYNESNAALSVAGPYSTMSLVSDGNTHWYIVNVN